MKKFRKIMWSVVVSLLISCSVAVASDFSITYIKPVFNPSTPRFGDFETEIGIKNNTNTVQKVSLACLYLGLTRPGVYFKNEPQVQKQYKLVTLKPLQDIAIVLPQRFGAYHPETLGELIVTLVGKGSVKSLALKTKFHPKSQD